MNSRTFAYIAATTAFAALVIPVQPAAQAKQTQHHHYQIIDLGTFGGPQNFLNVEPTGNFINQPGTIVGGADTGNSTPVAGCYNPVLNPDCYISDAFVWGANGLQDLGTLPGGYFSFAFAINKRGQIAGVSENGQNDPGSGNPEFHAVLWENGAILDLGTMGGTSSFAGAINDRGQVIGPALNDIPDPYSILGLGAATTLTQTRAFLWENGQMLDLGTLGGPDSFPMFLNNRGQVAGMSYTSYEAITINGVPRLDPFLWSREKGMQDLGNFGGSNPIGLFTGFISGLNNQGQVTGTLSLPGNVSDSAFFWDGEKLSNLGALGGNFSVAYGLNDAGVVVGLAATPGDEAFHAFRWESGTMVDLGTVDGDFCSTSENINSKGQIVGASQVAPCGPYSHAFLWENGGPSVDLNALIPPNSPLQLTVASLITENGEIVAGGDPTGCSDNDSCNHSYVLIPCDDDHPGIEGCDYSLVDSATATQVRPRPVTQRPVAAIQRNSFRPMLGQ
jgi:probable HAF family extracellular repeat protein